MGHAVDNETCCCGQPIHPNEPCSYGDGVPCKDCSTPIKSALMRTVVGGMSVHTTHCCVIHGCKYGEDDCPVALGQEKQEYPCEYCLGKDEALEGLKQIVKELRHSYQMSGSKAVAAHYWDQLEEVVQTIEYDWTHE